MRYLTWLLRIALFILLLGFALKNNGIVSLRYLFDYEWQMPLVVALLGFLVIGVFIGILAMLDTVVRLRRELSRMRAELRTSRTDRPAEAGAEDASEQSS